jgi:hypothetical protein
MKAEETGRRQPARGAPASSGGRQEEVIRLPLDRPPAAFLGELQTELEVGFPWPAIAHLGRARRRGAMGASIDTTAPPGHRSSSSAATPGAHQQAYLDHLGLSSPPDRQLTLKIAAQFHAQEDSLRQQVGSALAQGNLARLAAIRAERSQLLVQTATQLMRQLTPDGVKRINDFIQRAASYIPKRVN